MWPRRPIVPVSSCAVAMSTIATPSSARRAASSAGAAMRDHRQALAARAQAQRHARARRPRPGAPRSPPTGSPRRARSAAPPRSRVRGWRRAGEPGASGVGGENPSGRNGASTNGSMPTICSETAARLGHGGAARERRERDPGRPVGRLAQPAVDRLVDPRRSAGDLVGRAPGHRLARQRERAAHAGVGDVDADRERDAERDAQDRQPQLQRVAAKVPRARARRPGRTRERSCARRGARRCHRGAGRRRPVPAPTRPSFITSTRSAARATSSLWVTRITVVPCRRDCSTNTPSTRRPVSASSAPVGSSASTTAGALTSARAIATRCCSPPDRWSGYSAPRSPSSTAWSRRRASTRALAARAPASSSGRRTFSSTVSVEIRLKNWKTKPIRARRNSVRARSSSAETSQPSMTMPPAVGAVDAGDQVEQRRLARAAAAEQRHQLAAGDVERQPAQHLAACARPRRRRASRR